MCKVINFGFNVVVKTPTNWRSLYVGINKRCIKMKDNYEILQIIVSMYENLYEDRNMTEFFVNLPSSWCNTHAFSARKM